jgi:hypothetical protein
MCREPNAVSERQEDEGEVDELTQMIKTTKSWSDLMFKLLIIVTRMFWEERLYAKEYEQAKAHI